RYAGYKDADDRGRTITNATKANGLADHAGILLVNGGPETIREHDDSRSVGAIVLRSDETAQNGAQTHDFEVGAADDATFNSARFTETDHREAHRGEIAELADGVDVGFE